MLSKTFQHIRGISARKEYELWHSGITSWNDWDLKYNEQPSLFKDDDSWKSFWIESKKALENEDVDFFAERLPRQEYYRVALTFPEKTLFLDIETTGLSKYYDNITLVGWSLGQRYKVIIKGDDDTPLRQAISKAKVIITFNGSIFDIPFLVKEFKDLKVPKCHVDLRFMVRRIGLSGGQKEIELKLGIKRPESLADIKGETAPLLWYKYCWGDKSALKQLISYNHADIEGMKIIFDRVVNDLFEKEQVPLPFRSVHRFAKNGREIECFPVKKQFIKKFIDSPYREEPALITSIFNLASQTELSCLRIVGIDLTGNESRPSGWCLLESNRSVTKLLQTDNELFKITVESKPTLVSIDSPLSLPRGRVSVEDDDPGRKEYGIMRYCERILKKRGVNVYPSLIPSMQKLTARGIKLATRFRSFGIPVIESYPGAAQDIMRIPRKRASLDLLAKGLQNFGITGKFTEANVTHDELDAITSAVVGIFFWSGKFEALGNEEEEYLIVPDPKADSFIWKRRKVIGLSGPIAAGKTTAGTFLKYRGFHYARFSEVLEKLLLDRGLQPNRQSLQQTGEEVNKNRGQRWLDRKLAQMLPKQGDIVIDGLRFSDDHAFLVETFGSAFMHIHITSPEKTRLKRYVLNQGDEIEFRKAVSHPVEANVNKLRSLAHIILDNSTSIKSFEKRIINAVTKKEDRKGKAILCP